MTLYCIDNGKLSPVDRTTFKDQHLQERQDLQTLLKSHIDAISPDTLVVDEEFCNWEDSRHRIDLLGVDKSANLVVIELKRTESGGYMELQAIRYAAMISALTFDDLVRCYAGYLRKNGIERDAKSSLLEFLGWEDEGEEPFGQQIKIVLASAEFSRELTTSVMWLNEFELDIRCVRMQPYVSDGKTYIDVQTVIPIPEAADYQVRIREKKEKERESRRNSRDFTKYDLTVSEQKHEAQSKRNMMYLIVSYVLETGGTPEQLLEVIPSRKFKVFEGTLDAEQIKEEIMRESPGGIIPRWKRFFCKEGEFFHIENRTYVLSNQWGRDTLEIAGSIAKMFPNLKIEYNSAV